MRINTWERSTFKGCLINIEAITRFGARIISKIPETLKQYERDYMEMVIGLLNSCLTGLGEVTTQITPNFFVNSDEINDFCAFIFANEATPHPLSQKKAIEHAKQLLEVSRKIRNGNDVTPDEIGKLQFALENINKYITSNYST